MIVIKEDNMPRSCWSLGGIENNHPGKEVRGVFKTAVSRICVLPVDVDV